MKPTVLIVDDDEEIRTQMKWALAKDYLIHFAEDRASALTTFEEKRPIVTLLDLGLPPNPNSTAEGMAILEGILALDQKAKVIIISGQGDKQNALAAVGAGAFDFHCKPVEIEELRPLLQRCVYVAQLEREYQEMQQRVSPQVFEGIHAASPRMQEVFASIRKVAKSTAPVLILGETGTGKEMAAAAIHQQSNQKDKPFVAINCNAIPENLLESELFGHEKGSFTGAHTQRKGLIESAAGGTLFLDEIGDLPPSIQVKLLRFLQEKRIQRVGGRETLEVEARVVAATNVDLKAAVSRGDFREDLYFRLAVVVINLPPLREREDDALLLARSFLTKFAAENGKKNLSFAPDTLRAMALFDWPGNVRELQNRVQRAVIMAEGRSVTVQDMELKDFAGSTTICTLKEARDNLDREMIERALKRHGGKITQAAAELGISRPTLYELMEKLAINRN